jgi:hypothetical protein
MLASEDVVNIKGKNVTVGGDIVSRVKSAAIRQPACPPNFNKI